MERYVIWVDQTKIATWKRTDDGTVVAEGPAGAAEILAPLLGIDPGRCVVLEVRAADRPGTLYDVLGTLAGLDLGAADDDLAELDGRGAVVDAQRRIVEPMLATLQAQAPEKQARLDDL